MDHFKRGIIYFTELLRRKTNKSDVSATVRKEITMRTLSSVILIVICSLLPVSKNAFPKGISERWDLAQLNLEVVNAEVTDEISFAMDTLSSTKDENVIVVTLKGSVKSPCTFCAEARAFTAVFDIKPTKGGSIPQVRISDAVSIGNGGWTIFTENKVCCYQEIVVNPGSETIRVAFLLPKGVNSFSVLYPTLAKGKATLSIQD